MVRSSPGCPGLALRGARLVEDLKSRIAETAIAAVRQHNLLADLGEIGEQRFAVLLVDLRAARHFHDHVGAARAVAVLAHAAAAVLGVEVLLVTVVDQRIEAVDRDRDHVAAFAAIAAIGAAELDEFLAPERHAAVAAVAGADIDLGFIEEFHGVSLIGIVPGINIRLA